MIIPWLSENPDFRNMRMALAAAEEARELGEVPIGAVIVHPELGVLAKAYNQKEQLRDATAHAEILALSQASEAMDAWRLTGTVLYSTLEPCAMCVGAIIQARVERLVYGARDLKAGAVESVVHLLEAGIFNHDVKWTGGVLEDECGEILTKFFEERRKPK